AGKLFSYDKPGEPKGPAPEKKTAALAARWQKHLEKVPDGRTGLDQIEFKGAAVLNQAVKMSLEGDVIRIWVTPQAQKPEGQAQSAGTPPADDEQGLQPKRMQALRDVSFASPQIGGRTERLEVWFEEGPLPA